jgi:hypothetical protein
MTNLTVLALGAVDDLATMLKIEKKGEKSEKEEGGERCKKKEREKQRRGLWKLGDLAKQRREL